MAVMASFAMCVLTTINRWKIEGTIRNMNVFNKTRVTLKV